MGELLQSLLKPDLTMETQANHRLLVVDDDRKLAGLIRDYLTPMGYQVELRHNGPDGLAEALAARWQLHPSWRLPLQGLERGQRRLGLLDRNEDVVVIRACDDVAADAGPAQSACESGRQADCLQV